MYLVGTYKNSLRTPGLSAISCAVVELYLQWLGWCWHHPNPYPNHWEWVMLFYGCWSRQCHVHALRYGRMVTLFYLSVYSMVYVKLANDEDRCLYFCTGNLAAFSCQCQMMKIWQTNVLFCRFCAEFTELREFQFTSNYNTMRKTTLQVKYRSAMHA